jgi:poly(3-hydroxybutyrate) depolymerase
MWYEFFEAQRNFFQALCSMPTYADDAQHPAFDAPQFNIPSIDVGGRRIAVVESVVDRTPFCELRKFERVGVSIGPRFESDSGVPASILVCAPLAGHHAVMLRETVETLLQDGDVYVTDWTDARDVPVAAGPFGLEQYTNLIERFMCGIGCDHLHVLAVCQAAVPALAATALIAGAGKKEPLSLTLLGGPIDTRLHMTEIDQLAQAHTIDWFRSTLIATVTAPYHGCGRRVYPGFIQHLGIMAAHPHRQMALAMRYWMSRLSGDRHAFDESARLLSEYTATLDMAEEYFLDMLSVVFQEHRLPLGRLQIGKRQVRPQLIESAALCTVEGDRDDITGAEQTHAAQALCSAIPAQRRCRLTVENCDHYDLFSGSRWQSIVHPAVSQFWHLLG